MQIITQRLRLREFESSDWPAVLAYQSDPRYLRFYPWESRTEQAENLASARVLEKTGRLLSVFKPKQTFIKGRWHDQLIYTISYHEWLGIASIKANIKYNI